MEYNKKILAELDASFESDEGSLFNNDPEGTAAQLDMIERTLEIYRPLRIVEIGTKKAYFPFVVLSNMEKITPLAKVTISTFDIDQRSAGAVAILSKHFHEHTIRFYCGDSKETFSKFDPLDRIDLMYIDGGHILEIVTSDMRNAVRVQPRLILVDDMVFAEVLSATETVLKDYEIIGKSNEADKRRMYLYANTKAC
jgi:hypothetical protein